MDVDTTLSTTSSNPIANSTATAEFNKINTVLSDKSDKTHLHDDRYYTETEINNLINDIVSNFSSLHTVTVNGAIVPGGYLKIGKLIICMMTFTYATQNTNLITNLPYPLDKDMIPVTYRATNTGQQGILYYDGANNCFSGYLHTGTINVGDILSVSFPYISAI